MQSEYGDIYRVSLEYQGANVREVVVKYFDTIPPCTSICVLKTGFLFAASEFGNHALYQFQVHPPSALFHHLLTHFPPPLASCLAQLSLAITHVNKSLYYIPLSLPSLLRLSGFLFANLYGVFNTTQLIRYNTP
jgi:hypothetical protein